MSNAFHEQIFIYIMQNVDKLVFHRLVVSDR